jgi:hypothetical protein
LRAHAFAQLFFLSVVGLPRVYLSELVRWGMNTVADS